MITLVLNCSHGSISQDSNWARNWLPPKRHRGEGLTEGWWGACTSMCLIIVMSYIDRLSIIKYNLYLRLLIPSCECTLDDGCGKKLNLKWK